MQFPMIISLWTICQSPDPSPKGKGSTTPDYTQWMLYLGCGVELVIIGICAMKQTGRFPSVESVDTYTVMAMWGILLVPAFKWCSL